VTRTILVLLALGIGGYLIWTSRHCALVRMGGLPEIVKSAHRDKGTTRFVLVYDPATCNSCNNGEMLKALDEDEVLYLIDERYSDDEIESFARGFGITGMIDSADAEIATYARRLCACLEEEPGHNLFLELDASGKLVRSSVL